MSEILVDESLSGGRWPEEFSGAWANIMTSYLGNIVFSLYFNNLHPEGTVLEDNSYLELPEAYISINPNGNIFEIYVIPPFRRNKIAAMMCAWTRTNFISRGIIVTAPKYMTDDAKGLYKYISSKYGENYNNPGPAPIFIVYLDFGGRSILDIERNYIEGV